MLVPKPHSKEWMKSEPRPIQTQLRSHYPVKFEKNDQNVDPCKRSLITRLGGAKEAK